MKKAQLAKEAQLEEGEYEAAVRSAIFRIRTNYNPAGGLASPCSSKGDMH